MRMCESLMSLGLVLAVSPWAAGAIVVSEDFQGQTVGAAPTGTNVSTTAAANTSVLVQDGGGIGTAGVNRYLAITDASTTGGARYTIGSTASTTGTIGETAVQFDFLEPATGGNEALNLRLAETNDNPGAGPDIFLANGVIQVNAAGSVVNVTGGTYATGVVHTLLVSVNDNNDTYSISLNGNLLQSNIAFRNANKTVTQFVWQTFNGAQQTMFIDNILISDTAVIPEPASAALAALGGLALLRGRRR